jgi:hypothetical protein
MPEAVTVEPPAEHRKGGWVAAVTVSACTLLALVGAVALGRPLLRSDAAGAPGASPAPSPHRLLTCVAQASSRHPGDDPCARIAADRSQRRQLSQAERDGSQKAVRSLTAALVRQTRSDCRSAPGLCVNVILPADVSQVRQQLTGAGYPDPVVRVAQPTDPAPAGSVIYAVAYGSLCLVGYLPEDSTGQLEAVGALPDGRCLSA